MAIKTAKTDWRDIVLVCRKCSKKLDGGFGPNGDCTFAKALRKSVKAGKGRKASVAIKETGCFDICPKGAVVAINATRPRALLIVPGGADMADIGARLGLVSPELTVVGEG